MNGSLIRPYLMMEKSASAENVGKKLSLLELLQIMPVQRRVYGGYYGVRKGYSVELKE